MNRQFAESELTSSLKPVIAMPDLPGGMRVARIGATFDVDVHGKKTRCAVRERASHMSAKVVARCLGVRRGSILEPCPICAECEAKGETGLDLIEAKHNEANASEMKLRQKHEQHVLALFSADLLDPEGHKERLDAHKERLAAITTTKTAIERQALLAEWYATAQRQPGIFTQIDPRVRGAEPVGEVVGLLSHEAWGDNRQAVTM